MPADPLGAPVEGWKPPAAPDFLILEGRHVTLSRLSPLDHVEPLFDAFSEDKENRIWDYLPYGPFATIDDFRPWMAWAAAAEDPYFLAIERRDRGLLGGVASYLRISPKDGSIEVGHINYAPLLQNSIAATEAMFLMMRWAFEAGYRRYEWKCNALNLRSRRAAQRLGFSFEGVFRQATVVKGRNRDTAWFSVIDKEWPALKACFETWLDDGNFDAAGRQKRALSALTRPGLAAIDPALPS